MRIEGREIATVILEDLKKRVGELQKKGVTPHFVVILVGDDPASKTYVHQKELKAQEIGAKSTVVYLPATITQAELLVIVKNYNDNKDFHGIIVQRPLPAQIDGNAINLATNPEKDIDAFNRKTLFSMPLALAVIKILQEVHKAFNAPGSFSKWLISKNIVVVGKGQTGGGPVITLLKKIGATVHVVDSKTVSPEELTKHADIIISTVGKPNIITPIMLKKGTVLIGVGMYKGEDGKMHGDYNEDEIKDTASFYTPIPGGAGPVNVAMLLSNLVKASETQKE